MKDDDWRITMGLYFAYWHYIINHSWVLSNIGRIVQMSYLLSGICLGMIPGTVFTLVVEYRHDQTFFFYGRTFEKWVKVCRIIHLFFYSFFQSFVRFLQFKKISTSKVKLLWSWGYQVSWVAVPQLQLRLWGKMSVS